MLLLNLFASSRDLARLMTVVAGVVFVVAALGEVEARDERVCLFGRHARILFIGSVS